MRPAILTSFSRWRFSEEEEEEVLRPPLEEEEGGGVGGGRPDKKIQRIYQGKRVQIKIAPPSFVLLSISVCYTAHHLLRRRCLRRSFDPAASASCVQIRGLSFPKKNNFLLHFFREIPYLVSCAAVTTWNCGRCVGLAGRERSPEEEEEVRSLSRPKLMSFWKKIQKVFRIFYFLPAAKPSGLRKAGVVVIVVGKTGLSYQPLVK